MRAHDALIRCVPLLPLQAQIIVYPHRDYGQHIKFSAPHGNPYRLRSVLARRSIRKIIVFKCGSLVGSSGVYNMQVSGKDIPICSLYMEYENAIRSCTRFKLGWTSSVSRQIQLQHSYRQSVLSACCRVKFSPNHSRQMGQWQPPTMV